MPSTNLLSSIDSIFSGSYSDSLFSTLESAFTSMSTTSSSFKTDIKLKTNSIKSSFTTTEGTNGTGNSATNQEAETESQAQSQEQDTDTNASSSSNDITEGESNLNGNSQESDESTTVNEGDGDDDDESQSQSAAGDNDSSSDPTTAGAGAAAGATSITATTGTSNTNQTQKESNTIDTSNLKNDLTKEVDLDNKDNDLDPNPVDPEAYKKPSQKRRSRDPRPPRLTPLLQFCDPTGLERYRIMEFSHRDFVRPAYYIYPVLTSGGNIDQSNAAVLKQFPFDELVHMSKKYEPTQILEIRKDKTGGYLTLTAPRNNGIIEYSPANCAIDDGPPRVYDPETGLNSTMGLTQAGYPFICRQMAKYQEEPQRGFL